MLNKEKTYLRDHHLLQRHPLLQPKMRAILLDWLMEVSCSPAAARPAGPLCSPPVVSSHRHIPSLRGWEEARLTLSEFVVETVCVRARA